MKVKTVVLSCLIALVVLCFAYESSQAKSKDDAKQKVDEAGPKIGVVSIRKIFQDSKKNAKYREDATSEQNGIISELEKLSKDIEADRERLNTLKDDSKDYLTTMREIMEKQAKLQAQQDFHKQHMELKDQRWTEQLYGDVLRATDTIAKKKGLDLVFEKDEVELPAPSANELMLTIRTHKLLYNGGCLDITDEVMAQLDGEN